MGDHSKNCRDGVRRLDDVIVAIATPPGRGGVGILRLSGPDISTVSTALLRGSIEPRRASYRAFYDSRGQVVDRGIALYFNSPASYTGEDVLELQGHGSPVALDLLVEAACAAGARLAAPGEYTRRAFLNGRLDLAQAEAVADLIEASSAQSARAAIRSLEGEFSRTLNVLDQELAELRAFVEAAIDFPEEEIDFLSESHVDERVAQLILQVDELIGDARRGALLTEGVQVVLGGPPNVGKSSLMNRLARRKTAIVTDLPGTTRDLLRESVNLDGLPIHLTDTAGLRESVNPIEAEGVARARRALEHADLTILVIDDWDPRSPGQVAAELLDSESAHEFGVVVRNKADLTGRPTGEMTNEDLVGEVPQVRISAHTGDGLDALVTVIKRLVGYNSERHGDFSARRRHLQALITTGRALTRAKAAFDEGLGGEFIAEDLKQAQGGLAKIVGERDNEQLLGLVFSRFCIGK